jgi:DNA polymerase I-like protein with 3'-5' exonuclease and polymerase domains
MSALYSAAFQIQATIQRQANNHVIQSTGASLTKQLQEDIWDCQPFGAFKWVVQPLNIHDEILAVVTPECVEEVEETVIHKIDEFKQVVPLTDMTWESGRKSWMEE